LIRKLRTSSGWRRSTSSNKYSIMYWCAPLKELKKFSASPHSGRPARSAETGRPALGDLRQLFNRRLRQILAVDLAEESANFRTGKAQIVHADLSQLPAGPQPAERKGRVLAGGGMSTLNRLSVLIPRSGSRVCKAVTRQVMKRPRSLSLSSSVS